MSNWSRHAINALVLVLGGIVGGGCGVAGALVTGNANAARSILGGFGILVGIAIIGRIWSSVRKGFCDELDVTVGLVVCGCVLIIGEFVSGAAVIGSAGFLGSFIFGALISVVGNVVFEGVKVYGENRRRRTTSF